ncbi:L,D-transpeptidase family protein [Sagittula sp. M10.9X]|uniref:L,D-transpeptidase family protein n=2 Tax=Sagittula salina TaxID=2820268 RepID=A0A940MS45_9RHOB|nr:L,D-transpeptidase family protein [Sagittula salina]
MNGTKLGRVSTGGLRAVVLAGLMLAGTPTLAAPQAFAFEVTAYKQALAESLGEEEGIAAFYRARNFDPIWTGADDASRARRLALIEAFGMADVHGLPTAKYDARNLLNKMAVARTERDRGLLEVSLSRLFISFANDLQSGIIDDPGRVDSQIKRELPRRAPADLLARLASERPDMIFRSLVPPTQEYSRLMRAKLELEHTIRQGGWGATVPAAKLERGDTGEIVVALRNRLEAMGYLKPSLTARYDSDMEAAVRLFQADHGLAEDGVAGGATMGEINVAPEDRLKSVIVAMERERWLNLPEGRGKRHILVNLVDFHARIIDDDKVTFETRSVIGHQEHDRRTPEFSDEMTHMVINPFWYVPRSIIVKEYLPLLRSNPGAVGHLEIIDARGRVVSRGQGFAQYSGSSFPFSMRQRPGPRNALGSVKFMFPNKYNIYLHDTPSQSLFSQTVRTFSHGCIRLDDPHEFAYALLAPQEADPVNFFQSTLRTGRNAKVTLDTPVPVHLIYRTAFTKAKGHVNYRADVYGRDAEIWRALQNEGVSLMSHWES